MIQVNKTVKECEVLVVGGGIAGLMAGIAAADAGAKTIIVEKANTWRSGSGSTGNDHFCCYIPEVHGTPEDFYKEFKNGQNGKYCDKTIQMNYINRSFEVAQDWLKWGIDMKPHGDWEFNGHAFPGRPKIFLKYDGKNQKEVLTKEAIKKGAIIDNKTDITELLTNADNEIIGAMGLQQEKGEIQLYQAKAVIVTTGGVQRLYPSVTPSYLFNTAYCPNNTGSGMAAAYRRGAELVNLDIPRIHAGPKYMERCGKATWIGVLKDSSNKPVGPFVTKPNKELGDITTDVWKGVFGEKMRDGTGPTYMDCSEIADDDLEYMLWGFECEGISAIIDIMDKQGIDLKRHMIEFTQYNPILFGRGLQIDIHAATNIPGLYAAGDGVGNFKAGIPGAAVYGRVAGENASVYAKTIENKKESDLIAHPVVVQAQQFYNNLLTRENGGNWKEFNAAVQQLMDDYAGTKFIRSESALSAGYKYLNDLEEQAKANVGCKNIHELMRALETFDLLLIGKLICRTAIERKETRELHKRADYTFTNPLLADKFIVVKDSAGVPEIRWRNSY